MEKRSLGWDGGSVTFCTVTSSPPLPSPFSTWSSLLCPVLSPSSRPPKGSILSLCVPGWRGQTTFSALLFPTQARTKGFKATVYRTCSGVSVNPVRSKSKVRGWDGQRCHFVTHKSPSFSHIWSKPLISSVFPCLNSLILWIVMTTEPHLLRIQNTDRLQKRKKLSRPDRCDCKYFYIWCLAESMLNIAKQEISSAIWRWPNVQKKPYLVIFACWSLFPVCVSGHLRTQTD